MGPDNLDTLSFRVRPDRRPRRQAPRKSSLAWIAFSIIAAILFVLVIGALLQRTAWTAGASPVPATSEIAEANADWEAPAASLQSSPVVPMVYRCVDGAGGVSLQSQPCGPHQRMTRAVPASPDIEPPRPRVSPRPATRSSPYAYSPPSAIDRKRIQRETRCAMARRSREQTLENVGLNRTFDLLRQLDDMVAEACKGG